MNKIHVESDEPVIVQFLKLAHDFDFNLRSRCLFVEEGRNRRVYVRKHHVIKIPRNAAGMTDNEWEGSVSNGPLQTGDYYIRYAKTRLIYVGEIPVLFMERVEPASYQEIKTLVGRVPEWVHWVDCGQVGFNMKGTLVAYDYGIR